MFFHRVSINLRFYFLFFSIGGSGEKKKKRFPTVVHSNFIPRVYQWKCIFLNCYKEIIFLKKYLKFLIYLLMNIPKYYLQFFSKQLYFRLDEYFFIKTVCPAAHLAYRINMTWITETWYSWFMVGADIIIKQWGVLYFIYLAVVNIY